MVPVERIELAVAEHAADPLPMADVLPLAAGERRYDGHGVLTGASPSRKVGTGSGQGTFGGGFVIRAPSERSPTVSMNPSAIATSEALTACSRADTTP